MTLTSRSASGLPLLLASYVALVACSGGHEHDHDHDHDHDHGEGHVHVAPHADEGGVLVELGDHFANAEFVLDPEGGRLTMYTYGGHAEKSVRSPSASVTVSLDMHGDAPLVVELAAQESKLSGETVGDSSMFMGADPGLVGVSHFHGKIHALTVLGTEFTDVKFDYDLPSEDHDGEEHDGHDHDGEGHDGEEHEGHDHDGEGHDGEGDGDHGE